MSVTDKRIVWDRGDGAISILIPSEEWAGTIEELQARDVPSGVTSYIVNYSDFPSDRNFIDAWAYSPSGGFSINMTVARDNHRAAIRQARKAKLAELDVEFQRALESGASTTSIVAKKQALRDAPADSSINDATDGDALKAQWNTSILGSTPYK